MCCILSLSWERPRLNLVFLKVKRCNVTADVFFSRRMQPASWRYYVFFLKRPVLFEFLWIFELCGFVAQRIFCSSPKVFVFFVKFAELPCQVWCRKLHDFQVLVDFKTSDHFFLHGGTFSNLYSIHNCITSPVLISKRFIDKNTGNCQKNLKGRKNKEFEIWKFLLVSVSAAHKSTLMIVGTARGMEF